MSSLGTRLHQDCNGMVEAVNISCCDPSTCTKNVICMFRIDRDCKAMGDAAKIPPRIRSTCTHNAILSLLNIHIIPSHQIYLASDNSSLVLSISCLTTSCYLWNDMCEAINISHGENFQSNGCPRCSHWFKFRDRIHVSRVFGDYGERQG
jgi:hypothetical protein